VALADGPWVLLGSVFFAVFGAFLLPVVIAPMTAITWCVRATLPTAEEMARGDRNRSWPG
jgi:hypothetical protein